MSPIDRAYFDAFGPDAVPSFGYGTRVIWRQHGTPGSSQPNDREGVGFYVLCWMGLEPMWNVRLDTGEVITLAPTLGDWMRVAAPTKEGQDG